MNRKIQSTPAKPSHTKPACFFLENVSCCLAILLFVYHFFGSFTFEVLCGCAWKLLQFTSMHFIHLIQQGFYSGFSSVPCDSCIVVYQTLKKILYSVVEEIDLDLHAVNYLPFGLCSVLHSDLHCYLFLATSLVCFGVNALTQCHNRTECA